MKRRFLALAIAVAATVLCVVAVCTGWGRLAYQASFAAMGSTSNEWGRPKRSSWLPGPNYRDSVFCNFRHDAESRARADQLVFKDGVSTRDGKVIPQYLNIYVDESTWAPALHVDVFRLYYAESRSKAYTFEDVGSIAAGVYPQLRRRLESPQPDAPPCKPCSSGTHDCAIVFYVFEDGGYEADPSTVLNRFKHERRRHGQDFVWGVFCRCPTCKP